MKWTVVAACAGLVLAVVVVTPAHAEPPTPGSGYGPRPNRVDVETSVIASDTGVIIYVGLRATTPGAAGRDATPGDLVAYSGPVCHLEPVMFGDASYRGYFQAGFQENPGTYPHSLRCDDRTLQFVWIPTDPDLTVEIVIGEPAGVGADPLSIAEALLGIVPLPPISVGANPDTGLVAMPSWYWIEGYGGELLTGSETLGDTTVEVEIWPDRYEWLFGDGGALTTTSLGIPYPGESDIQHVYEQSSLSAGGAFEVRLDIVFSARYRVITEEEDGEGGTILVVGDWEDLGPMTRSFTRVYPVQQLQSVLTAGSD